MCFPSSFERACIDRADPDPATSVWLRMRKFFEGLLESGEVLRGAPGGRREFLRHSVRFHRMGRLGDRWRWNASGLRLIADLQLSR
jgi:hypothetical protein